MQFLLLIYEGENRFNNQDETTFRRELGEYRAFGQTYANAIKGGNALQPTPTARTVRVQDGKPTLTDGPFVETKEQLGGYYLVEANDINEATQIASNIPGARYGGVEVRPIMTFS